MTYIVSSQEPQKLSALADAILLKLCQNDTFISSALKLETNSSKNKIHLTHDIIFENEIVDIVHFY